LLLRSPAGADSLALCLLLKEWAEPQHKTIIALSVDHGLRAEAGDECAWVQKTLQSYGVEHHTLIWSGEKPSRSIQNEARKARYDLLENWCVSHNISDLFLGHHLDDQAETFLMRLARGSGVDGLSAMQMETTHRSIRIIRPLLSTPKQMLIEYLNDKNQSWIEDPSNENEAFDRVKMRNAMAQLSELGLGSERLAQTAQTMQRVRKSLDGHCQNWLHKNAQLFEEGYVLLKSAAIHGEDEEVILRGLSRIGKVIGAEIYPPRLEKLERLWASLQSSKDATLMGCRWIVTGDEVLICRETRSHDILNSIYSIDNKGKLSNFEMRCLGEDGWAQVVLDQPDLRNSPLAKPVIYGLVSFWDKEGVSVVPHLGYKRVNVCLEVDLKYNPQIELFS